MKIEASPATDPRRGWHETVLTQRGDVMGLLDQSPSLRDELPKFIELVTPRARAEASAALALWGEQPKTDLNRLSYTEDQVLGDWFPQAPVLVSRATGPRRRARNR